MLEEIDFDLALKRIIIRKQNILELFDIEMNWEMKKLTS